MAEERPYRYLPALRIWTTELHKNLSYSDGIAVESRLLGILRNCSDVTAGSNELRARITDWPSEYHFSPLRHNLLRAFPFKSSDRILELGCGCGAITRLLGETGATVVAVEGSSQRASIAAERCRDLRNVQIYCDNLAAFVTDEQFDFVTLIGVLEYAPLFVDAPDPVMYCLKRACSFLGSTGQLIIAIENQLGLKYFAGSEEDHTGETLFGLHGLYAPNTPVTFGRQELLRRLRLAGVTRTQFYYPFPDYKLPSVLLSEGALIHPALRVSDLLARAVSGKRGGQYRSFHELLAWEVVAENGLVADLANSFLIFASLNHVAPSAPSWLATFYSTARRTEFWTETIIRPEQRELVVRKRSLCEPNARGADTSPFVHHPPDSPHIAGRLWVTGLWRLIAADAAPKPISIWMQPWLELLRSRSVGGDNGPYSLKFFLPADFIDCTPFNLIQDATGQLICFDAEWHASEPVPAAWIVIRGLLFSIASSPVLASRAMSAVSEFIEALLTACGIRLDRTDWDSFEEWECRFQTFVSNPSVLQRFDQLLLRSLGDVSPTLVRSRDFQAISEELAAVHVRLEEVKEALQRALVLPRLASTYIPGIPRRMRRLPSLAVDIVRALVRRRNPIRVIRSGLRIVLDRGLPGFRQGLQSFLHGTLDYEQWVLRHDTLREVDHAFIRLHVSALPYRPLISVLMPVYNTAEAWLKRAIDSVCAQLYANWELCIADDASTSPHVRALLEKYVRLDQRIRVVWRESNGHISAASNSALTITRGEFIALLDHDDELPPHALYMVAVALQERPDLDLIYSDEDKIDEAGRRFDPYFKPDWNPDLFTGQNMVSHLGVYRTALVRSLGGFREGYEGSQDWDLALRVTEVIPESRIHHIPHVLYHWRAIAGSAATSASGKPYASRAAEAALHDHLIRTQNHGHVLPTAGGYFRIAYAPPSPPPLVSVIIPTRNGMSLLRRCIESLQDRSPNLCHEIIVVDNQSDDPATLSYLDTIRKARIARVLSYDSPFNYSAINNLAAKAAVGDFLCLLNNDMEVASDSALEEMLSQAARPGIGVVGAMLYYPDNRIQHAGVLLGLHGCAGHLYAGSPRGTPGYMRRASLVQNLSAVTAACIVVRKSIYEEMGGLDEVNLPVAFNDVDFCLRVRERGYRNVWTPFAEFYHHESASRGPEDTPEKKLRFQKEVKYMRTRWGHILESDPAHNPNLSLSSNWPTLAQSPRARKPWQP